MSYDTFVESYPKDGHLVYIYVSSDGKFYAEVFKDGKFEQRIYRATLADVKNAANDLIASWPK